MHLKAARRIISGSVWVLIASHKWQLYKKLLGHPGFTKTIHTTNDPLVKQPFNKDKLVLPKNWLNSTWCFHQKTAAPSQRKIVFLQKIVKTREAATPCTATHVLLELFAI